MSVSTFYDECVNKKHVIRSRYGYGSASDVSKYDGNVSKLERFCETRDSLAIDKGID